jgi:hypothetical protein
VAVPCLGYDGERAMIRPAHFFDDDFNSPQGTLVTVPLSLRLHTAAAKANLKLVGAGPVTRGMVTGGAANETRQANGNLAAVFRVRTAFPAHSESSALAGLRVAAHCDLVVTAANLSTSRPAVEIEFARLFAVPPTVARSSVPTQASARACPECGLARPC